MYLDFDRIEKISDRIVIRPDDDAWGPYEFQASGALPSGVTVFSAAATAYLYADSAYTEVPGLIEPGSVNVGEDTKVVLRLQGTANGTPLTAGNYYLKLTLTLSNSGTKTLTFGPIIVESFA